MDNISIRQIQVSDNFHLAQIIKNSFIDFDAPKQGTVYSDPTTNNLYELFLIPNAILWVALINEEVVGCCGIYPTANLPTGYTELVKFYIQSSARGKGVGKFLLQKSINSAKALGYTRVYLECTPQFKNALSLYEKFDFGYIKNALGNSGHGGCSIFMIKEI